MQNKDSINIRGEQIRQVLTKFYYKNSHLHYLILLEFEGKKVVAIKEFSDYTSYKKVFGELQRIQKKNLTIRIPRRLFSRAIPTG